MTKSDKETLGRIFARLEALEKWLSGTPDTPGLASKVDSLKADVDHRFDSILFSLKINNWLTGLIVTILAAGALKSILLPA